MVFSFVTFPFFSRLFSSFLLFFFFFFLLSCFFFLIKRYQPLEKWAPVFAKICNFTQQGLYRMLRRQCDCEDCGGTCSESVPIGHVAHRLLAKRGERMLAQCLDYLNSGWTGWRFHLTEDEVFFLKKKRKEKRRRKKKKEERKKKEHER